jgi:hypothetical protein
VYYKARSVSFFYHLRVYIPVATPRQLGKPSLIGSLRSLHPLAVLALSLYCWFATLTMSARCARSIFVLLVCYVHYVRLLCLLYIRERPDHFSSAKSTKSEQKCLRSNFWKPSAYLGTGKYARSEENGWAKTSEPEVIGLFPDVSLHCWFTVLALSLYYWFTMLTMSAHCTRSIFALLVHYTHYIHLLCSLYICIVGSLCSLYLLAALTLYLHCWFTVLSMFACCTHPIFVLIECFFLPLM